ncbi:MAG: DUF559 domain-containing protein [Candidatus Pacebacteria bacterium]|nr:DUF559 domain-containing protein [Candidatus Paceibacterota bacterium]
MQKYKFLPYNKNLVSVARELRKNQTEAEIKFGAFIKNCDFFKKYKFTTQKLLDNFIVDFYCSKLLLVIEIDGEVHNFQKERDKERDNILIQKYGFKIIRFTNKEILNEIDKVEQRLKQILTP